MEGRTISHFRILAKIGEGGMGVVYKAEDVKLGRPVALKILPENLAGDEERRLLLIREARTAASVNHPNIAAIHEIDEADGVIFIAMEYVEGKTLRPLLSSGRPLPMKEALKIATGIAEGLARAHQARVIHRDLKPENVMVAADGHVKILDFGLAKILQDRAEATSSEMERLETISKDHTKEGRILGTVAYMSPEQARGKSLDSRSDLFSFGIVLYEMVTGKPPFRASTKIDTLTAILRETPTPAIDLNPEVPAELSRILGKCLEKDPADRYQDSRDLVVDLRHLVRDTDSQPTRRSEVQTTRRLRPILWASVLAVVLVGAVGWFAWNHWSRSGEASEEPEVKIRQLTANPPENPVWEAAISPDGKLLAYGDLTGLYLLSIATGETRSLPLPSSEVASWNSVRWFPDGTRLLLNNFAEKRPLWSYSILSGAERKLREGAGSGEISPDGSLIAFGDPSGREIWTMGAGGEGARRIIAAEKGDLVGEPVWSPDSQRIAYSAGRKDMDKKRQTTLESVNREGRDGSVILSVPASTRLGGYCWIPGGRLIYGLSGSDPNTRESSLWEIAVEESGRPKGTARRIVSSTGTDWEEFSASSDGKRIAFLSLRWQSDVYVGDLEDGGSRLTPPRRLTLDERSDEYPVWTRDSRSILFASNRLGNSDIFKQARDNRSAEPVVTGPDSDGWPAVTADGGSLLFWRSRAEDSGSGELASLMKLSLSGGPPQLVFDPRPDHREGVSYFVRCSSSRCVLSEWAGDEGELIFYALNPVHGKGKKLARTARKPWKAWWALSPDGSSVAVVENEGRLETLSFADEATREIAVKDWKGWGDLNSVAWSHDGQKLFVTGWSGGNSGLLLVDMEGTVQVVWQRPAAWVGFPAVSPDGRHLAIQAASYDSNAWMIENF